MYFIWKNLAHPLFIFNVRFVIGYYKEITFLQIKKSFNYFIKTIESTIVFITQPIDAIRSWH